MSTEKPSKETYKKWLNDPTNWRFGIFYYNKEDKRLLPPKRTPSMGWTVNFANPYSILLMVGFLLLILFIVFLMDKIPI